MLATNLNLNKVANELGFNSIKPDGPGFYEVTAEGGFKTRISWENFNYFVQTFGHRNSTQKSAARFGGSAAGFLTDDYVRKISEAFQKGDPALAALVAHRFGLNVKESIGPLVAANKGK